MTRMHARGGWSSGAPLPPFPPCMYSAWFLGVRDARVEVPLLPHHRLDASHQGLQLPCAGSISHGKDNGTVIQTLPDSPGLGGVQVMVRHKVAQDGLVLGREASSPTVFCQVALSYTFHAFPVCISARSDRNAASSGNTQHQYLCSTRMGGFIEQTIVTMLP